MGSKAKIYDLIGEALTSGVSVLLVSSDFEEVARICHRALVFDRGRISLTLRGHEISVPRLIGAASAGAPCVPPPDIRFSRSLAVTCRRPAARRDMGGDRDRHDQHAAVEHWLDIRLGPLLLQARDGGREHQHGEHGPQTLTRPGSIEVAPNSTAANAGSRYSGPTALWPTRNSAARMMPADPQHGGGDKRRKC